MSENEKCNNCGHDTGLRGTSLCTSCWVLKDEGRNTSWVMPLRDRFAMAALTGMAAGLTRFRDDAPEIIVNRPREISQLAYLYADCMIEAREAR